MLGSGGAECFERLVTEKLVIIGQYSQSKNLTQFYIDWVEDILDWMASLHTLPGSWCLFKRFSVKFLLYLFFFICVYLEVRGQLAGDNFLF